MHSARIFGFFLIATFAAFATPAAHARIDESKCLTNYYSNIAQRYIYYCIDRTTPDQPMQANEPVAYFMHGIDGNSLTWIRDDYASALEALRESGKPLPPMTFISFDTYKRSFFSDFPGNPQMAWETLFITEFMPMIEKTYGVCNQRQCRALIGESMGGFGALKTAFRHTDLFSAVAVNSPALPAFNLWAPFDEWLKFYCVQKIGPLMGGILTEVVRRIFGSEESWEANDPIQYSTQLPAEQFPAIYFDMGGRDTYGFNVGYEIFKGNLDARAIPYQTNFEPEAGHDMWKRHAGDAMLFLLANVSPLAEVGATPNPAPSPVAVSAN